VKGHGGKIVKGEKDLLDAVLNHLGIVVDNHFRIVQSREGTFHLTDNYESARQILKDIQKNDAASRSHASAVLDQSSTRFVEKIIRKLFQNDRTYAKMFPLSKPQK
jgi:hypothetical protein